MIMTPGQLETQLLQLKAEVKEDPYFTFEQALFLICEIMRGYGYDSCIDIFEEIKKGCTK